MNYTSCSAKCPDNSVANGFGMCSCINSNYVANYNGINSLSCDCATGFSRINISNKTTYQCVVCSTVSTLLSDTKGVCECTDQT